MLVTLIALVFAVVGVPPLHASGVVPDTAVTSIVVPFTFSCALSPVAGISTVRRPLLSVQAVVAEAVAGITRRSAPAIAGASASRRLAQPNPRVVSSIEPTLQEHYSHCACGHRVSYAPRTQRTLSASIAREKLKPGEVPPRVVV